MNAAIDAQLDRLQSKRRRAAASAYALQCEVRELQQQLSAAEKKLEIAHEVFDAARNAELEITEKRERQIAEIALRRKNEDNYCPVYSKNDLYDIGRRLIRGALTFEEAFLLVLDDVAIRPEIALDGPLTYKGVEIRQDERTFSDEPKETLFYYDVAKDSIVTTRTRDCGILPKNEPRDDIYYLQLCKE